jgi:hypothetical protein
MASTHQKHPAPKVTYCRESPPVGLSVFGRFSAEAEGEEVAVAEQAVRPAAAKRAQNLAKNLMGNVI